MWPKRIENPIFLLNIYGNYPSLTDVEVTHINLGRDGPMLSLSLITTTLPYNPPVKWKKFNRVFMGLQFLDLISMSVDRFERRGLSSIQMWDDLGRIHATCNGAVGFSLQCGFLYVNEIKGLLVETSD